MRTYVTADVGFAEEWWNDIGKEEVRKYGHDMGKPDQMNYAI